MRPTADPGTPRAYGYWELVWLRLKRDRMAMASVIALLVVFLICFAGEPIAEHLLGHGPNDIFPSIGIFVSVLAFNLLGESLRQAIDPQARP